LLVSAFASPRTVTPVQIVVSPARQGESAPLNWQSLESARRGDTHFTIVETGPTERQTAFESARVIYWPTATYDTAPFAVTAVRCREVCRGRRTVVLWDETAIQENSAAFAATLIELLEGTILPRVEATVGSCDDIDGNGALTLAVSPRMTALDHGPTRLSAFVRAADFQSYVEAPWSNRADLVYLAPHIDKDELVPILTHEITHVAQFSQWRRQFSDEPWPLPDWLLEGHAHAVEARLTGRLDNLQDRLDAFRTRPESCPLVIADAVAAGRWREPGSRGATAAFCMWLTDRYGIDWWSRVSGLADDEDAWQREFGREFTELYRRWTIDLASGQTGIGTSESARITTHDVSLAGTASATLTGTATAYFRLPQSTVPLQISVREASNLQLTLVRQKRP